MQEIVISEGQEYAGREAWKFTLTCPNPKCRRTNHGLAEDWSAPAQEEGL